jgi:hypothetical protein
MDPRLLEECVAAVLLALKRVDLSPQEQLAIIELTAERLRIAATVDEDALVHVYGVS